MPKEQQGAGAVVNSSVLGKVRVRAGAAAVRALFGGACSRAAAKLSTHPSQSAAAAPEQPTTAAHKRRRRRRATAALKKETTAIYRASTAAALAVSEVEADLEPRKRRINAQQHDAPNQLAAAEREASASTSAARQPAKAEREASVLTSVARTFSGGHRGSAAYSKEESIPYQFKQANCTGEVAGFAACVGDDDDGQLSDKETEVVPAAERLSRTAFVGNIPTSATRKQLVKHFAAFGLVESVRIRSAATSNPKLSKRATMITGAIDTQAPLLLATHVPCPPSATHRCDPKCYVYPQLGKLGTPHLKRRGRY